MKVVTIIQARTSSSRLPRKVMMDIYGKCLLERVIDQSLRIKNSDAVWVATSTDVSDDVIELLCERMSIPCYRGSLDDVRSRFYHIAKEEKADIIVRVTADNPLTEPEYADQLIDILKNNPDRFYARMDKSTILDGTGTEVFTFNALQHAMAEYQGAEDREHVTQSIKEKMKILELSPANKEFAPGKPYFVGVDTFEDYKRLNILFQKYSNGQTGGKDVLKTLIKQINSDEKII